ncbi:hypothetical protein LEN26_020737 [Aphanomyces euteiches]|nr:hypothetical protein LEN26_020737 [Aphanomyces euteiches]KAH9113272.1 hypothetical protein AeMF1_012545 [Aphanomyces euteiches]KAH9197852.1 hypothetical protein AeNC1_000129 [Aphanomyces euteiches]
MPPAPPPPPEDPSYNHQYAYVNGIRMHFIDVGPRDAVPVVLVHGFPDLWYGWKYQIAALRDSYRVIVADNRGFGGTDAPPDIESYRRKNIAQDYVELLDFLNIEKAVFIGHDWGGFVVWNMCRWHPNRVLAVAAVCTPYMPALSRCPTLEDVVKTFPEFEYQIVFSRPHMDAVFETHSRNFFNLLFSNRPVKPRLKTLGAYAQVVSSLEFQLPYPRVLPAAEFQYYVDQYLRQGFRGPLNWYRTQELDLEDNAGDPMIHHRALFIGASHDRILCPYMSQDMEKYIPGLQRETIDKSAHWVLLEKPDKVNAILLDWLAPLGQTRSSL